MAQDKPTLADESTEQMTVKELAVELAATREAKETATGAVKSALTRKVKRLERELGERGVSLDAPVPEEPKAELKRRGGNGRSARYDDAKFIAAASSASDAEQLVMTAGYGEQWKASPQDRFLIRRRVVAMVKAGQLSDKFLSREVRAKKTTPAK